MWIYFIEQVWCYNPDEWARFNWRTREYQARYWDTWHYHKYPNGQSAYKTLTVYPQKHMVQGNDYIDF